MIFCPHVLSSPAPPAQFTVEWEETDCLLCGRRHWSQIIEAPDLISGGSGLWFVVVQCQDCGLCFTNPRPSPNCIGHFYPAVYRPHRTPSLRRRSRRRGGWLASLRPPRRERDYLACHGQCRLLDFGCGGGSFM